MYIYIVTDCEFDGPLPGRHSMLAFGSVAVSETGNFLGEFEAVLEPLEGATQDAVTAAFWAKHPEAWRAATTDPQPVAKVMTQFVQWIASLQGEPIFVAHPVALDGPWIDFYLQLSIGRQLFEGPWVKDRLFRRPPLCLMSMLAGYAGRGQWLCDVEHYPTGWLGSVEHTHRAIDDARGYANLLRGVIHKTI